MNSPSKTSKRLGIVGAAAVVGLVPISMVAAPAFAASGATLALASTAATAATTATNNFTTTNAAASNQLTITAILNAGATGETLPACKSNGAATPACSNYTVTYTPLAGSPTADPVLVGAGTTVSAGANNTAQLFLTTGIPSGSAVSVSIAGVTNGAKADVVSFSDTDQTVPAAAGAVSSAGAAATTNTVTLTAAIPVPSAGVSNINPTAFNGTTGNPFTLTGTNFAPVAASATGTGAAQPVVCFVPSGTAAPSPTTGAPTPAGPCVAPSVPAAAAGISSVTTTQIQGVSPALPAGTYNVVVYNYDPNIGATGGYTTASGTTATTLVASSAALNFVPESGVRVVDSRSGLNLPKGALPVGTPVGIPLATFAQSPTLPTNLPLGAGPVYTGLDVNVTAVAPASGGNIQMWTAAACTNGIVSGKAVQPATVNFQSPQDTNNSQVIPVTGAIGATSLCVQDNGAAVNLVVDITGYTTAAYNAPAAPTRLLDTRDGTGSLLGPLSAGTVYRFQTTGLAPGTQVALNVTDVAPSSNGYVTVFPEPATGAPTSAAGVPNTAVTNFIPGTDSGAMLVTTTGGSPLGANGYLDVYAGGTGTYNLVVDELGTFVTGAGGSSLKTVAQPFRIYDSRPGPIGAGSTVTVVGSPTGAGSNFVPSGALGVMGNLSDINPAGQGYVVTFPAGGVVPATASIANFPSQTRNTNNLVALNPSNGSFSIYAGGAATNSTYDVDAYIS